MSKPSQVKRKPRTHFEQVPLEVVKQIAGEDTPKIKGGRPRSLIVVTGAGAIEDHLAAGGRRRLVAAPLKKINRL
jgi:hypothetical protein